ncbi:hypothetical protein [Sporosarcina sp. USHLN248]|uniref:hypothetical protein n=1 Tax=Sporosarcina sp. USHLN248 TaxID=3081300 RepID=UPI003017F078
MTEKVKLSKQVAEAIEKLRNADYTDFGIVSVIAGGAQILPQNLAKCFVVIRKWTYQENGACADKLLDALRTGYEIEDEYKVGDWVIWDDRSGIAMINSLHLREKDKWVSDVYDCWEDKNKIIRHATTEEIKAEKERRKWAKIGRKPGEFRDGDLGISEHGNYIDTPSILKARYELGQLRGFYPAESLISFGGGKDD